MDVDARLEAIEDENDRLRERIRQLEKVMGMDITLPLEWGLTGHERMVFGVLMARSMATKDACMAALYRNVGKDEADPKIVDVFVCKMRKKLGPFGVVIKTVWGAGYKLEPDIKAIVRHQMAMANGEGGA